MFWNRKPQEQDIFTALENVVDPLHAQNIVALNWVSGVIVQDGRALVTLNVDPKRGKELETVRIEAEKAIQSIKGIREARVILTAEKEPEPQQVQSQAQSKIPDAASRAILPDVKYVIAVASGKGGVGKSTVAVNLAVALQQRGLKIGILDADIYGPSIPMLLGVRDSKPEFEDDYILPIQAQNLSLMSMGFLVEEDKAMVWRGPMIQKALTQMLRDVRWGSLDVLIIDMPPGTGDAQLTIAQKVPLTGAVVVSTPQDVALLDAVKGVKMFEKTNVPVLGMIENMSFFCCPNCNYETAIFSQHGAENRAAELNVPFLGALPLHIDMRVGADTGHPIAADQAHDIARRFATIAERIWVQIDANQKV